MGQFMRQFIERCAFRSKILLQVDSEAETIGATSFNKREREEGNISWL